MAYESQLKSDRAEWHRRLAAAIQEYAPGSVEENAALIAEHLQAAGELHAAYGWHMRAGNVGDQPRHRRRPARLGAGTPDRRRAACRGPRPIIDAHRPPHHAVCHRLARAVEESRGRFAELRELCSAAGDKVSLAIGMTGLAAELLYAGRSREGSRLVSEQMALLESIGDPTPMIGLAFAAFCNWGDAGEFGELLRWSQTVIDLAEDDPAKGAGFGFGSPLAAAVAFRGLARWWLGRPGWRQDLHDAVAMARNSDPATLAAVVAWTYSFAIRYGVLRADDSAVRAIEEAVQTAEGSSHDTALAIVKHTLGIALLNREAAADRHRGLGRGQTRPFGFDRRRDSRQFGEVGDKRFRFLAKLPAPPRRAGSRS